MNRTPIYTHRLNDRGDLVRVEVAPDNYTDMPKGRDIKKDDIITPPPPPKFPPPPPPPVEPPMPSRAVQHQTKPVQFNKAKQTNGHLQSGNKEIEPKRQQDPVPRLKLYADVDVKALEKNPMHNDIMNAAQEFKGRRDGNSDGDNMSSDAKWDQQAMEHMNATAKVKHPVYDAEEMRKKKQNQPMVVNTEMQWNKSKPLIKRNTYTVIPNAQLATHIAGAQDAIKHQPKRSPSVPEGLGYTRIEDVPQVEALMDVMATHDEKGNVIPDWKRKLMARNYRVKLCKQLES